MILFVFAIIVLVAGFVAGSALAKNYTDKANTGNAIRAASIVMAVVLLVASCVAVVPTGYTEAS